MENKLLSWLGLALLQVLACGSAFAGTIGTMTVTSTDPQIFFCQSAPCTSAPGGTAIGKESNLISNPGTFFVGAAGNHTFQNPLLIIVGVYDGNGTPTVSFADCATPSACPSATVNTYGLNSDTGSLTSTSGGTAFSKLGLTAGGSDSFSSWSMADTLNGFGTPTGFSLYAFELDGSLTPGAPFMIDESGAAAGSFIVAYDCLAGTGSSTGCAKNGDIGQSVMTNTGLLTTKTTTVPEPGSSLGWLGTGLAGMVALLRRRLAS